MSVSTNNGSIGAVATNGTFNAPIIVGANPAVASHSNGANQGALSGAVTLLVIVAKDKEYDPIRSLALRHNKACEPKLVGDISTLEWTQGSLRIVMAFMNGMGFSNATKLTTKLLDELNPHYITTIGVCGGPGKCVEKPLVFHKASLEGEKTYECDFPTYGRDELWRNHQDMFIRNKEEVNTIWTIKTENPPDEEPDAFEKKLKDLKCQGQDMEIAAIWKACRKSYDPRGVLVKILPAIKAVSDNGNKEMRDKHFVEACQTAWWAFVALLETFQQNGLLGDHRNK